VTTQTAGSYGAAYIAEGTKLWKRTGECDSCRRPGVVPAQCCRAIILDLAYPFTPDQQKWLELHPGFRALTPTKVRIDIPCGALDADGLCSLYGLPSRPKVCRDYPMRPSDIEETPGCVYEFELIKE